MAAEKGKIYEVDLEDARASWLRINEPEASVTGGKEKYSGEFIIDPSTPKGKKTLDAVMAKLTECVTDMWGPNGMKAVYADLDRNRKAVRKGDTFKDNEGEVQEQYKGKVVVKAARHLGPGGAPNRPLVLNRRAVPIQFGDDQYPYNGCYVNATVRFYAVDDKDRGGKGLFASIEVVQYFRKGDAFAGGAAPVDYKSKAAFQDFGDEDEDGGESPGNSSGGGDDPLG